VKPGAERGTGIGLDRVSSGGVEQLLPGTEIAADELQLAGLVRPARLRIERRIGEVPHGDGYHATVGGLPVLVTFLDPKLPADVRTWLFRNVQRAASIEHRSLLAQFGPLAWGDRWLLVQGNPGGQSARQLLLDRAAKGRTIDPETAQTIVGHVCNALVALHAAMVHGFVNADAVWISTSGRVSLGDPGVGQLLARVPRFERARAAGRLANLAPEHLMMPTQLAIGTDVFGLATLLIELLTGRPLREAGAPLEEVGIWGPPDLSLCLERATAPDAFARPPDVLTFKAELADALGASAQVDLRPPGSGTLPAGMVMPSLAGTPAHGVPVVPRPPPLPPPAPIETARGRRPTPAIDSEALRQLELATRRIAESDGRASALELTEDVGIVSSRIAAEAAAEPSASGSLRLGIGADDAALRLVTLDGEVAPEAAASGSGNYLGDVDDSTVDVAIAAAEREELPESRGTVTIDDDDVAEPPRTYRLVRDEQDFGELTVGELRERLQAGRISSGDTLVHPLTGKRLRVGDLADLHREAGPARPVAAPTTPIVQRPMMLQTRSSARGGTLLLVLGAIAIFGGIGVWLWLRAHA
jgi:hypothetical protein